MFGQTYKTNLLIQTEGMLGEMWGTYIKEYRKQGVKYLEELLDEAEEVVDVLTLNDKTQIHDATLQEQLITALELSIMRMEFFMDITETHSPTIASVKKQDRTRANNLLLKLQDMLADYYYFIAYQKYELQQDGNVSVSRCGTA